jgi:hypothetical protein
MHSTARDRSLVFAAYRTAAAEMLQTGMASASIHEIIYDHALKANMDFLKDESRQG